MGHGVVMALATCSSPRLKGSTGARRELVRSSRTTMVPDLALDVMIPTVRNDMFRVTRDIQNSHYLKKSVCGIK
jgi:hypothetical protein